MKVYKSGKEVKNATVVFDVSGNATQVLEDGVYYDVKAYELKEEKTVKKTKVAPKTRKASGAMTTEDLK